MKITETNEHCYSVDMLPVLYFKGNPGFLPQGDRGAGGAPLRQFALGDFAPPEVWSENNRKISITKEICITIDFAPLKKFLEGRKSESQLPLQNLWAQLLPVLMIIVA